MGRATFVNRISLLCLSFCFFITNSLFAQKGFFTDKSIGIEVAFPVGDYYQSNKAYGYISSFRGEKSVSSTLSVTMHLAINHYRGEMIFWDGQRSQSFTLMPVLLGVRKYFKPVYVSMDAGPAFSLTSNARGSLALMPAIGRKFGFLDMSLKLFSLPISSGNLTQNYLQRGGYSYIGFSVNYSLSALKK